ncbi:hypothetical protein IQ07DRAFT_506066 [Pyrenochaeta sp. DS3sAY3a]|nr:hypothetical protein IQ07DRAFT_506066 [Pyrenochaeta sp. DS3sAY3a]
MSSGQADFTLIAQNITCAYPISDIYAPTPRYLYYCVLFLTFVTIRYRWLSNIFLGAAVAYAASAAIHAFIILSRPPTIHESSQVSIPFIPALSNRTRSIEALVVDKTELAIQPDAVELDIDTITAVVVTAYLVGLPLQIWSRTIRSRIIIRYMILLWNLSMLAGTICALLSWPTTNLASPQFRFCFAGFLDPTSLSSSGWDPSDWVGSWNSTILNIFDNPATVWQGQTNNCFYPCFNTTQILRQSTSLKATVTTSTTKFAKLHNPSRSNNDRFGPLLYVAIIVFSVAQFFLYIVSALRLGSDNLRPALHEPHRLWKYRKEVWQHLKAGFWRSCLSLAMVCHWPHGWTIRCVGQPMHANTTPSPDLAASRSYENLYNLFRFVIDVLMLVTLIACFTLFPVVVLAFIGWIEWYIRNDGSTNESINQVGQWAPLVSVAVILFAGLFYQLQGRLASVEEIRLDIQSTERHLRTLTRNLAEHRSMAETQELR